VTVTPEMDVGLQALGAFNEAALLQIETVLPV
jgi:hypothetical protein